MFVLKGC